MSLGLLIVYIKRYELLGGKERFERGKRHGTEPMMVLDFEDGKRMVALFKLDKRSKKKLRENMCRSREESFAVG